MQKLNAISSQKFHLANAAPSLWTITMTRLPQLWAQMTSTSKSLLLSTAATWTLWATVENLEAFTPQMHSAVPAVALLMLEWMGVVFAMTTTRLSRLQFLRSIIHETKKVSALL
jgi:hypothetical protein